MDHQIKQIVEESYTYKSFEERGYDEEVPMLSFSMEDLSSVLKGVVHVCADMCDDLKDRKKLIAFAHGL